jgi:hypothetical protein
MNWNAANRTHNLSYKPNNRGGFNLQYFLADLKSMLAGVE